MRTKTLALAATCCISSFAQAQPLTLAEVMRRAEEASPVVLAREAQLAAVEGRQREAGRIMFNNPSLAIEAARRRAEGVSGSAGEYDIHVTQPVEIGGQQSHRRDAAAAALEALRAEIEDDRRQARADAASRFQAILSARRKVALERRATDLFSSVSEAVTRRRAAGEDTRLDANVAAVEAERSRNALSVADEQLLNARSELAALLQLPPMQLPEVVGEHTDVASVPIDSSAYTLDQLLAAAQSLPRLRALGAREQAARAKLDVERANRYPDVTVGVATGREGFTDVRERVTRLTVSVPLPLFKRNEAAIGQALTDVTQAEVERVAARRDAEAQVRRLWSRLASQRERVLRLQRTMLPASVDNQQLASRSRSAGQIGLLEQVQINRQALDAERELNDALAEYRSTQIELELAAGLQSQGARP